MSSNNSEITNKMIFDAINKNNELLQKVLEAINSLPRHASSQTVTSRNLKGDSGKVYFSNNMFTI